MSNTSHQDRTPEYAGMTITEARSILRSHLDDTDGDDLDVEEYADQAAEYVADDEHDEVAEAIRVVANYTEES